MSEEDNNSKSIFSKIVSATSDAFLDFQIKKAKAMIDLEKSQEKNKEDEDLFYFKSVTEDPTFRINSQGYKDKPNRITDGHLKQMSYKNSIVAATIQTRQNQVAAYSSLVKSSSAKGWRILLADEDSLLEKLKEKETKTGAEATSESMENVEGELKDLTNPKGDLDQQIEGELSGVKTEDDQSEKVDWEQDRRVRSKLQKSIKKEQQFLEQFIQNCGIVENRPFETSKWDFDAWLRAGVRDTLTYDKLATEVVLNQVNEPHHFFPVDASTIKFAGPSLKHYKGMPGSQTNVDFLYPEKQIEAMKEGDTLRLNEKYLEADKYKYVQVIRNNIERAYTEEEMKFGTRNPTTDIYNNGYGISELELLVSLVSSHLNTEYYNQAYFTQGFSAKGILHLKAAIPKRKLETIRMQWHHMIKGNRNSFQTPIFAGMDEVKWIPLTQNHSDIEFQGWLNYLIKAITAIYQIDPAEIGFYMRDTGAAGGLSGDNTKEKLGQSKDKGLYPLLKFFESYINKNFIKVLNPKFKFEFTGLEANSKELELERQNKEVKYKKTVNEIRAEDGLEPLPGMDDMILDPTYFQWYQLFSEKGKALKAAEQQNQATQNNPPVGAIQEETEEADPLEPTDENLENVLKEEAPKSEIDQTLGKSLKIEYYTLGK